MTPLDPWEEKKEEEKKIWENGGKEGIFFVLSVLIFLSFFPFWMVISFSFYLVGQAKESTGEQDQGFFL